MLASEVRGITCTRFSFSEENLKTRDIKSDLTFGREHSKEFVDIFWGKDVAHTENKLQDSLSL